MKFITPLLTSVSLLLPGAPVLASPEDGAMIEVGAGVRAAESFPVQVVLEAELDGVTVDSNPHEGYRRYVAGLRTEFGYAPETTELPYVMVDIRPYGTEGGDSDNPLASARLDLLPVRFERRIQLGQELSVRVRLTEIRMQAPLAETDDGVLALVGGLSIQALGLRFVQYIDQTNFTGMSVAEIHALLSAVLTPSEWIRISLSVGAGGSYANDFALEEEWRGSYAEGEAFSRLSFEIGSFLELFGLARIRAAGDYRGHDFSTMEVLAGARFRLDPTNPKF